MLIAKMRIRIDGYDYVGEETEPITEEEFEYMVEKWYSGVHQIEKLQIKLKDGGFLILGNNVQKAHFIFEKRDYEGE